MKLLLGAIVLSATGSVLAQEATTPATAARTAVKASMATEVVLAGVTKNAPFTADENGETVRLMPDGNRIVQSWTGTMARNSQGRIRRDIKSGEVGDAASRPFIFGGGIVSPGIVAVGAGDAASQIYLSKVDAENAAAARTIVTRPTEGQSGLTLVTTTGNDEESRHVLLTKIESAAAAKAGTHVSSEMLGRAAVESEAVRAILPKSVENSKWQTRKESLGTRDFGGVQADGVRLITTIAVGAIGNEREIEMTSETWFSKELGVVVYSKRIDPRVGETTYQMTNIQRVEPDASLFPNK
jgi:hypothetical protein